MISGAKRLFRLPVSAAVAVLSAALILLGCGGSSEAQPTLTKAQFIKRADAICEKSDKKQETVLIAYEKKHPNISSSKSWQEKILRAAALPPIKVEVEELATLPAPQGDEQKVKAMTKGLEQALEKSEADSSPLLKGAGAFAQVEKLLIAYGFKGSKSCVNPL